MTRGLGLGGGRSGGERVYMELTAYRLLSAESDPRRGFPSPRRPPPPFLPADNHPRFLPSVCSSSSSSSSIDQRLVETDSRNIRLPPRPFLPTPATASPSGRSYEGQLAKKADDATVTAAWTQQTTADVTQRCLLYNGQRDFRR